MVLKFISQLWKPAAGAYSGEHNQASFPTAPLFAGSGAEFVADDPEFPGRTRAEVRRLREERASAKRESDQLIDADREETKHEQHLLLLTITEDQRRMAAQLTADIADARQAIAQVHDRAVVEEASAREVLEAARGRAVVLPDGRRVYFTADGAALYGEDDRQITEARTIADAQQRHVSTATTYEEITGYRAAWQQAAERTHRLREALVGLDDIEARLAKEHLSPTEVQALNDETKAIIDALPIEAREEYDRIRTARHNQSSPAYLSTDPAFETAPLLHAEFQKAVSGIGNAADNTTKPDHRLPPAYIAAPDF